MIDLAHVNPENAKTVIQEIIKEKHEEFEKNKKKYPSLDTVSLTCDYSGKYISKIKCQLIILFVSAHFLQIGFSDISYI